MITVRNDSFTDSILRIEGLWRDFLFSRNKSIQDKIILFYDPIAEKFARQYMKNLDRFVCSSRDLLAAAKIGLVESVLKFDPRKYKGSRRLHEAFCSYLSVSVRRYVIEEYRFSSYGSRNHARINRFVSRFREEWFKKHGFNPTWIETEEAAVKDYDKHKERLNGKYSVGVPRMKEIFRASRFSSIPTELDEHSVFYYNFAENKIFCQDIIEKIFVLNYFSLDDREIYALWAGFIVGLGHATIASNIGVSVRTATGLRCSAIGKIQQSLAA